MITVLVVDDQPLLRHGLSSILSKDPGLQVVGEAGNGLEAVQQAQALRPDLVLMDIRMPVMDGLTATQKVLALTPAPKVLVLTTFDADEYVWSALRAGASGYLLKDSSPEDLTDAVRRTVEGDAVLSAQVTRQLISAYAQSPRPGQTPTPEIGALTARELDVLRLLATGRSNAEIARSIYLAETTVKTHVARILAKLGLRDRVQAVVLAYESGVVRPGSRGER